MLPYIQRPVFTPHQNLTDEDLQAIVAYVRDADRRHRLGPHIWGIVSGLTLHESEDAAGDVTVALAPGMAIDGFGRAMVLEQPLRLSEEIFAGQTDPLARLWIGYEEDPLTSRTWAPNACCDDADAIFRSAEGFALRSGRLRTVSDRHDPLLVATTEVEDPRAIGDLVQEDADLICDGSVAFQTLADQSPLRRWWVPLGYVGWIPGAPGRFRLTTDDEKIISRTLRRHGGLVAEEILSSEGMIRLRRRETPRPEIGEIEDACVSTRLTPQDFSIKDGRVQPNDLISLEGDARALGQMKLFGTRLEFRRKDGTDDDTPLYMRRGVDGGRHQVEMVLGEKSTDENRFVIGSATDYGSIETRIVFQADGKIGVGADAPGDYHAGSDNLVIAGDEDAGLTIASGEASVGSITFADGVGDGERAQGFLRYDHQQDRLYLGADGETRVTIASNGRVGVGTETPRGGLQVVTGQSVGLGGNTGLLVLGEIGARNVALDGNEAQARNNGAGATLHLNARGGDVRLHNNLAQQQRLIFTESGRIGVGTEAPDTPLHIRGDDPDIRLDINSGSPNERCEIRFSEDGSTRSNIFWDRTDDRLYLRNGGGPAVTIDDARLGVGLGAAAAPATRLHVRDEINDSAVNLAAHVALLENTSAGASADVLALRVGATTTLEGHNFITFFDANGPVGSLQGNAGSVALNTAGADFAERLPLLNTDEVIKPGDVVGVHGGRAALRTEGADAVLVATTAPAVLGNSGAGPSAVGVTFIGQAPVRLTGPATPGDILVASGAGDGAARAIAPPDLSPDDLTAVVGRVWSEAREGMAVAAIGVTDAGVAGAAGRAWGADRDRLNAIEKELASLRSTIEALGRDEVKKGDDSEPPRPDPTS